MFSPVVKRWSALSAIIFVLAVTACSPSADATTGQVVRVIDGDTLVVNIANADTTIRLLNIDTPETKHPDKAIECFGPEASAFLEGMLPPGTEVGLDFDVEREDQYGRTLAAVFLEDSTLVNAEIARQGLGSAVIFEPNEKYFDEVEAAQAEAQEAGIGVFDEGAGCTVPAEVAAVVDSLSTALEQPTGATSASAAAAVTGIATALAAANAVQSALETGERSIRWGALGTAGVSALATKLSNSIRVAEAELDTANQKVTRLKAAEDQAARDAAEAAKLEAERVAAEAAARVEADRVAAEAAARAEADAAKRAAEAAEAERIRNLPAPAPYIPPAPAPAPYVPPAPAPAPPPAEQNPYPGYNGPRCYAPGGKTWKPCG